MGGGLVWYCMCVGGEEGVPVVSYKIFDANVSFRGRGFRCQHKYVADITALSSILPIHIVAHLIVTNINT